MVQPHNFPHPFSIYAYNLRFNDVNELLERGEDVNQRDPLNETALHKAIMRSGEKRSQEDINNSIEMVRLLLNRGANVNLQDPHGLTPIHLAVASKCDKRIIQLMIDKEDCDLKLRTNNELTACHLAALSSLEYLKCFYKREPDLINWTARGVTMIETASWSGKKEIIDYVSKKSKPNEAELKKHEETCEAFSQGLILGALQPYKQNPNLVMKKDLWFDILKMAVTEGKIILEE
jgi:ankyrin repeat protein